MNRRKLPLLILFVSIFLLLSLQTTRPVSGQEIGGPEFLSLIDGMGVQDPESIVDVPDRIAIDNNWSDVASSYDWCYGNGTEIDPYVIENVSIDSKLQGTVILIRNTDEHFVIRNCYLSNSGRVTQLASGVEMINVTNGLITCNNFSANSHGVFLDYSSSVIITKNIFLGKHTDSVTGMGVAVTMWRCQNVTVQKNYGLNNYEGITSLTGDGHTIDGNVIVNLLFGFTADSGVFFYRTNYSSITNNTLYGVRSSTSQSVGLHVSGDTTYGIGLISSYNNEIFGNVFHENTNALSVPGYNLVVLVVIVPTAIITIRKNKKKVKFKRL